MALDPITAILNIVDDVVTGVSADKKEQLALKLQELNAQQALLQNQANIDQAEASNSNVFVAGWRPLIGWVCGLSFAWQYLLQPLINYFVALSGHPLPTLPVFDNGQMTTVLLGMLGLGGMRTFEKLNKVQKNH